MNVTPHCPFFNKIQRKNHFGNRFSAPQILIEVVLLSILHGSSSDEYQKIPFSSKQEKWTCACFISKEHYVFIVFVLFLSTICLFQLCLKCFLKPKKQNLKKISNSNWFRFSWHFFFKKFISHAMSLMQWALDMQLYLPCHFKTRISRFLSSLVHNF